MRLIKKIHKKEDKKFTALHASKGINIVVLFHSLIFNKGLEFAPDPLEV
jgi:hypothetical protein